MPQNQMTLAQFGDTIKAKHPEYADMDSATLGQKVLAKYPEYSDMVQTLPAGASGPLPGVPKAPVPAGLQGPPLKPGLRSWFDQETARQPHSADQGVVGNVLTGLGNIGGGAMSLATPLVHPLKAEEFAGRAAYETYLNPLGTAYKLATGQPTETGQFVSDILHNPVSSAEQLVGQAAGAKGLGLAGEVARPLATKAGGLLQDVAAENLNSRMSVGPKDTLYGQNPGRGILKSGIGLSTQRGLSTKVQGAMDANGQVISNIVNRADVNANAPTITPRQVAPAINGPIDQQLSVVRGPGNHSVNPEAPLDALRQSMTTAAPGASAPIYGPNAPEVIAPTDLWKTIRNIDQNTRFNPQPEVETVNEVGRGVRGGLRPILETVDPSLKPVSQNYSDLASARVALDRQASPFYAPTGLKSALASTLNSYPVRTGISSALYRTGSALNRIGGTTPGYALPGFSAKWVSPDGQLRLPSEAIGNADVFPANGPRPTGSVQPPTVTPAPQNPLALPSETAAGRVRPMIRLRAPDSYPSLAEDFARTRIVPTRGQLNRIGGTTLPSEHEGLALPPPPAPLALPATASPGDAQPMIYPKAPVYPSLAEEFARTRIQPTRFSGPPSNPFGIPRGFLTAPKPKGRAK